MLSCFAELSCNTTPSALPVDPMPGKLGERQPRPPRPGCGTPGEMTRRLKSVPTLDRRLSDLAFVRPAPPAKGNWSSSHMWRKVDLELHDPLQRNLYTAVAPRGTAFRSGLLFRSAFRQVFPDQQMSIRGKSKRPTQLPTHECTFGT